MGQQLFGSARSDARHRPNNGFLKAFDVLRPWLTNDKGRWPMAAFVATSLTESDQELCGLFCIMREKTVHVEIQDGRNQRTPRERGFLALLSSFSRLPSTTRILSL